MDLNALASQAHALLGGELRLRQVTLVLQLAPSLPAVWGDAVQLQQVLANLLLNAIDALQAIPPRQRSLVLATQATPTGVQLSVQDNGPGLSGTPPEKLFEPFYSTKPDGLGVGLSISRSIVEQHGGRLQVEQPATGGLRFCVNLPAAGAARLS
ncbi:MAG: hypothetical protein CFE45_40825 [Burkholderiales bacterium PBB5]|nr:MAG: hypothetical protein CFE45_40825 [Burkholderiales bacterium PBB5]